MDFLLWQLADSAFPTGGFSHSSGLEAAWQQGGVTGRDELISFLHAALEQVGSAFVPFVNAAYDSPARLPELDAMCDAFTTNHVANRASRVQGKAFLAAVERVFPLAVEPCERSSLRSQVEYGHIAPVFGAALCQVGLPHSVVVRLFLFNNLRGILAAAVRLNIVGPMDAQVIQRGFNATASDVAARFDEATLDDLAQTAPLLELWQAAQDRLYSRLFQS